MSHEERDLQTWFETLRASDRRDAPSFQAITEKKAAGFGVRRLAAAFALILAILITTSHRRQLPIEQLSQWRSPTQSLLDVPKSTLMTTAPSITR